MVPKTGSRRPEPLALPSEPEFAQAIGSALQSQLGASRRATKTIMRWADVSDRTARMWLHGERCPSALSLLALLAQCPPVLKLILRLSGHGGVELSIDLLAIEDGLKAALQSVRELRANSGASTLR